MFCGQAILTLKIDDSTTFGNRQLCVCSKKKSNNNKKNLSKLLSVSSSRLAVYESSSRALPKRWDDSLMVGYLFFGLKRNFKTCKVTN